MYFHMSGKRHFAQQTLLTELVARIEVREPRNNIQPVIQDVEGVWHRLTSFNFLYKCTGLHIVKVECFQVGHFAHRPSISAA